MFFVDFSVNYKLILMKFGDNHQGLTQTFLGSGPQDHQLSESGGPTIFLVVLRIKSGTQIHTRISLKSE